jgi:hypothetical protein
LLDQENDRNERESVCRIPPNSRQEPRFAEPVSDHREKCNRSATPVTYPMDGRDLPDLLTRLQDALNVAHEQRFSAGENMPTLPKVRPFPDNGTLSEDAVRMPA